jgi:hypothetical protein
MNERLATAMGCCLVGTLLIGFSAASAFTANEETLRGIGQAGGFLLVPLLIGFRSKAYLAIIRSAPPRQCPAFFRIACPLAVAYAVAACLVFVYYASGHELTLGHGLFLLAPFGALAFYMARWATCEI